MQMPRQDNEEARLTASVQAHFGRRLRASYRSFLGQPLPDEQIDLLLALRRAERDRRQTGQ